MLMIDVIVGLMWSRSFRASSRRALVLLTVGSLAVGVAGCAATLALDRVIEAYASSIVYRSFPLSSPRAAFCLWNFLLATSAL
jgi:hypothetical protein